MPVGLRLFLPEEWTAIRSAARRPACRTRMVARTKGEIALAEMDRLIAAGVRFGLVLAEPATARVPPSGRG